MKTTETVCQAFYRILRSIKTRFTQGRLFYTQGPFFCALEPLFCALLREEAIFAVCKRCASEGFACMYKEKRFSHEYRTKFYTTRCENADFRTRSVRKTTFYTRSNKIVYYAARGRIRTFHVVLCEQYELKTSTLHVTRDESPISTACCKYHIFHNTDT